jgi:hypothetical protein
MTIGLKILETTSSFHQKVIQAICDHLNARVLNLSFEIRDEIAKNIKPVFTETKEYRLLLNNDKIKADVGLPFGKEEAILGTVIDRIAASIKVDPFRFIPIGNQIAGGFNVGIVQDDYEDILRLKDVRIKSENGVNEWLGWMLLAGGDAITEDYHVVYETGTGRSRLAHMVEKGSYFVDEDIRGTTNDNWLTRALKTNKNMLQTIILNATQKEIERAL